MVDEIPQNRPSLADVLTNLSDDIKIISNKEFEFIK